MLKLFSTLMVVAMATNGWSQSRDLTPNKRKKAFGKQDFSNYKPFGLQFSLGGVYLYGKPNNVWTESTDNAAGRYQYKYSPESGSGIMAEIGMAHFPAKGLAIPIGEKGSIKLLSYWDWGIGIKNNIAQERFSIEYLDNEKKVVSSNEAVARFRHSLPYVRATAHKNFYFKSGHFIDLGIGFNVDYRMISDSYNYENQFILDEQRFAKKIAAQLHSSLGFGFKIRRGLYFIPSVGTPILGIYEWNKGHSELNWFSSTYRPIEGRLKLIYLFKDKTKSCNTGTEEDQKRNKEYMQNL